MIEERTETGQTADAAGSDSKRLVKRLHLHYLQMAPHVKQRATAQLLLEATNALKSLEMHSTRDIADGWVSVPAVEWDGYLGV